MYRVEDKFWVSERDLLIIQSRLEKVLAKDQFAGRETGYTISSLYFDDLNDTCAWESEEGVRIRQKYRIRIYNHSFDTIKLEIKYKMNNRVKKKSDVISAYDVERMLQGKQCSLSENSETKTLFNLAISSRDLRPKLIVEYDRIAYVYNPGNVRITLDRNIGLCSRYDMFLPGKTWIRDKLRDNNCVLEVKYDEFLPSFISNLIETGYLFQTSYSKYKLCREQEKYHIWHQ